MVRGRPCRDKDAARRLLAALEEHELDFEGLEELREALV
jgi:hypothetical protein